MKTNIIRSLFLNYFKERGHEIVPSSSLVPDNDPTLLFTNAGMVQFKNLFLGKEARAYKKATSSQRCVRAGGKHNDLENVGYTARHHTFFEMLGNFSFGDYFKREAIEYAWGFLTKVLKLPADKLWVTVFREDDEAARIWLEEIKIDPKQFSRCDENDNFWSMGDTGPCGPCSEIFYDHGPDVPGGPPGSPDADGDRYIEIWNLVFMQFDRAAGGALTPLPKPSVDTGMGLERIAAVMQGVHNNYEIDLFQGLMQAVIKLSHCKDPKHHSLRVIADHIRSVAFLIADGVMPSNEGRGYVLRRILRRAVRHGHQLGLQEPFFHQLVVPLIKEMGQAYPILQQAQLTITESIRCEEILFAKTLEQGLKVVEEHIGGMQACDVIPGDVVFLLYDTYGFPPDLTADIAREKSLTIDQVGFDEAMARQRARSQGASQFVLNNASLDFATLPLDKQPQPTVFTGYTETQTTAKVLLIIQPNLDGPEIVVLDRTPFYAESGGQVGDQGVLRLGSELRFIVNDTQKQGDFYLHYGRTQGDGLKPGDTVQAEVDADRRLAIMLNHSATHLLHAVLRQLLGEQLTQKGSLVDKSRLRFDFSHPQALTPLQLSQIELKVNEQIRANLQVTTQIMSLEETKKENILALFSEKYAKQVRVLRMGAFSAELCGGTHVAYTGQIGLFKIVSEVGVAAGIRRIEAVTGEAAVLWLQGLESEYNQAAHLLKTDRLHFKEKLDQILAQHQKLEKQVAQLQQKNRRAQLDACMTQIKNIQGVDVLVMHLEDLDSKMLGASMDDLKQKLHKHSPFVIVLASAILDKISLLCSISSDASANIHAGELLSHVASQIGGQAGGRADRAQGGGNQPTALPTALQSVYTWVEKKLCP